MPISLCHEIKNLIPNSKIFYFVDYSQLKFYLVEEMHVAQHVVEKIDDFYILGKTATSHKQFSLNCLHKLGKLGYI